MVARGMRVGVAVSGGADSVCLLHVLAELAAAWDLRLTVLHLNHKLRGEESDGDEAFVARLAESLGVPSVIRAAGFGRGGNLEQAGREARMAFFREMLADGLDRVATGHTRSDQAETVLYRFLRGSGTAGLSGIRPVTADGLIRPLIDVTRADVEAWLRERKIGWRTDATNSSARFARNRIRHGLLPELAREWNPAIEPALARTADWAQAEEAYWEKEISRLAAELFACERGAVVVRVGALRTLPLAVARRLIRKAMEVVKGDLRGIDFAVVASAMELALSKRGTGGVQAAGIEIRRSFDFLRFHLPATGFKADYLIDVEVPGRVEIPGTDGALCLELVEKPETSEGADCVYNEETTCLDWAALPGPLKLRNWRPGDQYGPLGMSGERKIKTLFQTARIPSWERRQWPILTDGVSVLWARQFGPAARLAARPETRIVLEITYGPAGGKFGIGIRNGGV
jgi:tRNA(Ile)-lysidine synthase